MPYRLLVVACSLGLAACVTAPEPVPTIATPAQSANTDAEVEALLLRADSLYSAGHLDEAIPVYQQGVRLAPDHLRAYEPLAYSYAKLGLFTQAEEWLQERRNRSKEPALDHCFLADLALRRGDVASARVYTDSLLFLTGEDPPWSLAACAAELETHLGEHRRAKRRLERAVAQLRREGKPLHGLSFLAFFALHDGETARADTLLAEHEFVVRERLARGEAVATSYFDLAAVNALLGNADAAVSHLREALRSGGWGEYWGDYHYLRADPIFASLHGHPEFERLMAEMRAAAERMRERVALKGE